MVPWGAYLQINEPKIKVLPTRQRDSLNVAMIYLQLQLTKKLKTLPVFSLNYLILTKQLYNNFFSNVKHAFKKCPVDVYW